MSVFAKARNCYLQIRRFLWLVLIVCFIVGIMFRQHEIKESIQYRSVKVRASLRKLDRAEKMIHARAQEHTTPLVVNESFREYRMVFMEGWIEESFFYDSDLISLLPDYSFDHCGHYCTSFKIGEAKRSSANMIVFQPSTLKLIPPEKLAGQYWVLNSFEELTNEEIANYKRLGYDKLVDNVIISPLYAQPFITFDKVFSRKKVVDSEFSMYKEKLVMSVAHIPIVVQLRSECNYNGERVEFPDGVITSGHRLKDDGNLNVTFEYYCFGGAGGNPIINKKPWFFIIDETACKSSQIDQLISVLKSKTIAIPLILETKLTAGEIGRITPPNSVIVVDKSETMKQLAQRLSNIVTKPNLFNEYTKWRLKYAFKPSDYYRASTDQDEKVLLRICQLCNIAAETPTKKINNLDEKCFDV